MNNDEFELRKALELDEEERLKLLYEEFSGEGLRGDDIGGSPKERLQRFYKQLESQARRIICNSAQIREVAERADRNDIKLGLTVCDALVTLLAKPAVFLMSAQIIHLGIGQFCAEEWKG